jgi:hypothetical protein
LNLAGYPAKNENNTPLRWPLKLAYPALDENKRILGYSPFDDIKITNKSNLCHAAEVTFKVT